MNNHTGGDDDLSPKMENGDNASIHSNTESKPSIMDKIGGVLRSKMASRPRPKPNDQNVAQDDDDDSFINTTDTTVGADTAQSALQNGSKHQAEAKLDGTNENEQSAGELENSESTSGREEGNDSDDKLEGRSDLAGVPSQYSTPTLPKGAKVKARGNTIVDKEAKGSGTEGGSTLVRQLGTIWAKFCELGLVQMLLAKVNEVLDYFYQSLPIPLPDWICTPHRLSWRKLLSCLLIVSFFLWLFWTFVTSIIAWCFTQDPTTYQPPSSAPSLGCLNPSALKPWQPFTMLPDFNDNPKPFEYTTKQKLPTRFSVAGLDTRDMILEVFLDGISLGRTTSVALDSSIDCGTNLDECLEKGMTRGQVTIPRGKHVIRVAWAGIDYLPDTRRIDWNGRRFRRFLWSLDRCN